jgi:hypothetical protein
MEAESILLEQYSMTGLHAIGYTDSQSASLMDFSVCVQHPWQIRGYSGLLQTQLLIT